MAELVGSMRVDGSFGVRVKTLLSDLPRTVLIGMIALLVAACGVQPPSGVTSVSPVPDAGCFVLAGEEIVSLAWSQDAAHLGVGLRTADGRPAARTVDVVTMQPGELVRDDRMIPESVVVTADGRLAWLRALDGRTEIVEESPSARQVIEVPDTIEAIQWTAIGYAAIQATPDGTTRVVMIDPDRPDDPTVLYETRKPVTRLWVTPDPEWVLLTVGGDGSAIRPDSSSSGRLGHSPLMHLTPTARWPP